MAAQNRGLDFSDRQVLVAVLFGAVLTIVGLLGFSGVLVSNDAILGVFGITPLHNAVHLLTGVVGLAAGYVGGRSSGDYNKYLGLVYLLVFVVGTLGLLAGIGFITGTGTLALNINWADNGLHLVLGVALAAVGYGIGQS